MKVEVSSQTLPSNAQKSVEDLRISLQISLLTMFCLIYCYFVHSLIALLFLCLPICLILVFFPCFINSSFDFFHNVIMLTSVVSFLYFIHIYNFTCLDDIQPQYARLELHVHKRSIG